MVFSGAALFLTVVWIPLGILPVFVRMLGFNFLPSLDWTKKSELPCDFAGLICATFVLGTCIWGARNRDLGLKGIFAAIFCPIMGFAIGQNVIGVTFPMAAALVAGHQVELDQHVAHANYHGSRYCHSPIVFETLPFMFDEICNIEDDLRREYSPGMPVVVGGYGTSFGLFEKTFHKPVGG